MPTPQAAQRVSVDVSGIAPGEVRLVECGRRKALLCNVAGDFFAVAERCTHAAFSLREGRLDGPLLECPLHGARFDVRDGSPVRRPASKPLATHSVALDGARAVIEFTIS
jgi:3-phenylpropionate/trans-cinnamate dioxygenase ferredoxin subunit